MDFEFFSLLAPMMVFLFGLLFGSFANVMIWRIPRGESLSNPPSHCPGCEKRIEWYDNIPVVSWLVLRGRCRGCAAPISPRYPIVELSSGVLWLIAYLRFGATLSLPFAIAFFYLLLVLSAIDLDTMKLPNRLVGLLAVIGLGGVIVSVTTRVSAVPLIPVLSPGASALSAPLLALLGAVTSAGIALLVATAYKAVRGADGFGMGDVKLLAVIGIFLSLYGVLVLFLASMIGAIAGLIISRRSGEGLRSKFPFGPYLALAALIVALWGEMFWAWYSSLLL